MNRRLNILKSRARVFLGCLLYLASSLLPPRFRHAHHGKTRILVFHHIDHACRFRAIMASLKKRYNVISYSQYLNGEKAGDRINVIIALDDGYRSWFENGLPVFREFGISPLLFVNSDFIGKSRPDAEAYCRTAIRTWPEASLSWDELKALADAGAEIGGHTVGHIDLTAPGEETKVFHAVEMDRENLARQLGQPISNFAYPFGRYGSLAVQAVRQAGYAHGFSSDSGFIEQSDNPLLLKRSNVGMRPPVVVQAMVEGWADTVSNLMRRLKGKEISQCSVN